MNTSVTIGRGRKKKKVLDFQGLSWVGGRDRTRTCDPIDVNDVLYQLSHATIYRIRFLGLTASVTSTGTHRIGFGDAALLTADVILPQLSGFVKAKSNFFMIYLLPPCPCRFPLDSADGAWYPAGSRETDESGQSCGR